MTTDNKIMKTKEPFKNILHCGENNCMRAGVIVMGGSSWCWGHYNKALQKDARVVENYRNKIHLNTLDHCLKIVMKHAGMNCPCHAVRECVSVIAAEIIDEKKKLGEEKI